MSPPRPNPIPAWYFLLLLKPLWWSKKAEKLLLLCLRDPHHNRQTGTTSTPPTGPLVLGCMRFFVGKALAQNQAASSARFGWASSRRCSRHHYFAGHNMGQKGRNEERSDSRSLSSRALRFRSTHYIQASRQDGGGRRGRRKGRKRKEERLTEADGGGGGVSPQSSRSLL